MSDCTLGLGGEEKLEEKSIMEWNRLPPPSLSLPFSLLEDAGDVDDRCAVGTKSTMETQRNPQAAGEQERRRKAP